MSYNTDGAAQMRPSAFSPRGLSVNPPVHQVSGAVTDAVSQISLAAMGAPWSTKMSVRLVVSGNDPIAFSYGTHAGLTLGNGAYMIGNTVETFELPIGVSSISVISSGEGSTLRVHIGEGA